MITVRTARQTQRAMQAAYAFGATVDKTVQELATSLQLPLCEAIPRYCQLEMRPLLALGQSALLISPGTGWRFGQPVNEWVETHLSAPKRPFRFPP
jgi:hypothetical protein